MNALDDKFGVAFCDPNENENAGEPNEVFVKLVPLDVLVALVGLAVVAIEVGVFVAPNVPKLNLGAFAKQK